MEMNNNHKAILYHMKRGAALHIGSQVASVTYPGDRNVPVNHDAANDLVENGLVREVATDEFALSQTVSA